MLETAPASELFVLERVRLLDGIPIAHSVSLVPLAYAPDLPSVEFTTASLYESLERAGIVPSHGEYEIDAQRASERLGSLLSVEQDSPVLAVSVRVLDQAGRPVELAKIAYREDAYRFRVVLAARHGFIAASA